MPPNFVDCTSCQSNDLLVFFAKCILALVIVIVIYDRFCDSGKFKSTNKIEYYANLCWNSNYLFTIYHRKHHYHDIGIGPCHANKDKMCMSPHRLIKIEFQIFFPLLSFTSDLFCYFSYLISLHYTFAHFAAKQSQLNESEYLPTENS